jgi:type III secretion system YscJ/HrcJ family lipoprotein
MLGQLFALVVVGCSAPVATDLEESEANEIVVALEESGIGADKATLRGDRFEIRVAARDLGDALRALDAADLPREREEGFEALMDESSLVPSASEESTRRTAAVSAELARSIERLPGVVDARVHLSVPERGRFSDAPALAPRGSVLVRHEEGASIDPERVRALVCGAVSGLSRADVEVVSVEVPPRATSAQRYVHVGPIAVAPSSAPLLNGLFVGSLALHALLAGALIYSLRRRRARPDEPANEEGKRHVEKSA